MAIINEIKTENVKENEIRPQTKTECTCIVEKNSGKVQLNTNGSKDRKIPKKNESSFNFLARCVEGLAKNYG